LGNLCIGKQREINVRLQEESCNQREHVVKVFDL